MYCIAALPIASAAMERVKDSAFFAISAINNDRSAIHGYNAVIQSQQPGESILGYGTHNIPPTGDLKPTKVGFVCGGPIELDTFQG